MMIAVVAYAADAAILGTYAFMAVRGRPTPFHWANALGAVPLIAVEISAHAWPVVPVTASFGLIGWYGVLTTKRQTVASRRP